MKNCYWQPTKTQPNNKRPTKNELDVIILGGGYTGLSVGRFLKQKSPGLSVAVLERDYVGFGASGRNGGFAMPLLGLNHGQLLRDAGLEKAKHAHTFMKECVDYVRKSVNERKMEVEMVDQGMMTVALNKVQLKTVRHEVEVLHKLGTTEARFVDQNELRKMLPSSTSMEGGVEDPNCVVLHPFKLAREMKKWTEEFGVEVCEGVDVIGFRKTSNGYEVTDKFGEVWRCKRLVVTTNAYSYQLGMFKSGLIPIYTYIVATEPLTPTQWKAVGWDKRNGIETAFRLIHYMRPTKDGRILLGGKTAYYYFGHQVNEKYDEHEKLFSRLQHDMQKLFPGLKGIKFSHGWGGPIGSTLNFFPTVGHDLKDPNLFWALGCCGHGVSLMNYVGKIISDLFHDVKSKDTELFFVNKKPLSILPPEPLKYVGAGAYKNTMWWWDRFDEVRAGKIF